MNAVGVQTTNWNWQHMSEHGPTFGKIGIKRLEGVSNYPGVHSDIIGQFSLFVPLFDLYDNRENPALSQSRIQHTVESNGHVHRQLRTPRTRTSSINTTFWRTYYTQAQMYSVGCRSKYTR